MLDHNQLDLIYHLKSYIPITECMCNHKATILEYMILNGKGFKLAMVYMGTVLFPFIFNRSIQYSCFLFLIKHFSLVCDMSGRKLATCSVH